MTEAQQIAELKKQNKELKATLKEGVTVFGNLDSILGISDAVNGGLLMFKLPRIIQKVQSNPHLIQDIGAYNEKIKTLDLD